LGGDAVRSRKSIPTLGIDPLRGDEVVSATENITFGGNG